MSTLKKEPAELRSLSRSRGGYVRTPLYYFLRNFWHVFFRGFLASVSRSGSHLPSQTGTEWNRFGHWSVSGARGRRSAVRIVVRSPTLRGSGQHSARSRGGVASARGGGGRSDGVRARIYAIIALTRRRVERRIFYLCHFSVKDGLEDSQHAVPARHAARVSALRLSSPV